MNDLFVIHADLGACKNIIKNCLLLDESVYFPFSVTDRLKFFKENVYVQQSKNNWFKYEYSLKDYEKFGISFELGDAKVDDIVNPSHDLILQLQKTNMAIDLLDRVNTQKVIDLPFVKFLCIYPNTEQAVKWQVRAYSTKKNPKHMHNYTYSDIEKIEQHKMQFGEQSWVKVNLYNFYQGVKDYATKLQSTNWPYIALEDIIIEKNWKNLYHKLNTYFHLELDKNQVFELLSVWNELHWNLEDLDDWEHSDIFDGQRNSVTDKMIRNHSCDK